MTAFETIGNRWVHPQTGEVRYYIDVEKASEFGGLYVSRYNTGNICSAYLNDVKISNSEACRILLDVRKVYYTEDGKVHIQWADSDRIEYEIFWVAVAKEIEAQLMEVA